MKNLTLILSAMLLSTSAFAMNGPVKMVNIYNCALPKDAKGEAIYGGPAYTIITEDAQVRLHETLGATTGHLSYLEVPMSLAVQEPEVAIYRARNVTADIGAFPVNGELQEFVTISVDVGNEVYSASCTK